MASEPKHQRETETHEVVQQPAAKTPTSTPPVAAQTPTKPPKLRTEFQGKKIVAKRPSRQGDDGYQLSTIDDQVTIIFEDGGEKVVKSSDLFEPVVV